MKFLFNFYLIFYVIYQVFAENENKTNIIEEILNNVTDDNDIIYIENSTFNILKEKYEKVKENLTNLEIKTVLLNLDELPENSTLEKFSNDLLNELKNKKNWFNENDSLIYSLFLSNNSGIIIVNYPNITNDTLEEMLNETKNDKPEDRISKVMNNLLDKIVTNPELELDDSSESNDNSTSQIKDDSTSESNDNSTSQIKDDSTSESNDNSTSQIKDDSTSKSQDNSTSQIKDDSTSESQDNSTSQIKDDSTSESYEESKSQSKDESKSQSKDESESQSKEESESQSKEESKSQSKDDSESQSKEESESQSKEESKSQSKDDSDDSHSYSDSDSDDGLSAGIIVLIVLSCVAGLIIIVIVVACLCKRNKQDAYNAVNQTSFKDNKLLDED